MDRKNFLGTALASAITLPSFGKTDFFNEKEAALPIIPKYLKEGDIIGITSPAGYITLEEKRILHFSYNGSCA